MLSAGGKLVGLVLVLAAAAALAAVLIFVGRGGGPPAGEQGRPGGSLTDEQMRELAEKSARKDLRAGSQGFLKLVALQSADVRVWGGSRSIDIENPLKGHAFWCVIHGYTPAAPIWDFIAVSRTGQVYQPFLPADFPKVLAAEDTSRWTDQDFMQAAELYIHLTNCANQDGWTVLAGKDDFLAVMRSQRFADPKGFQAVPERISPPRVSREGGKVRVTLYSWHFIGGTLYEWTIEFGPEFKVTRKELGQFGGGGYAEAYPPAPSGILASGV